VRKTCSLVSALQGPAIIVGRTSSPTPGKTNFSISIKATSYTLDKFTHFPDSPKGFDEFFYTDN
jgi:hypothetical protein